MFFRTAGYFDSYPLIVTSRTESVSVLISSFEDNGVTNINPYEIEYVAVKKLCDCFQNNLKACRVHPLNLLSSDFPKRCKNLNCSTEVSLESPHITNDYVECLQIQFNNFETIVQYSGLLHLKIPFGDENKEIIL
uniref:Uncharacterized protein n=1 Tax=Meloidogyne enterolobii TaxID=390850 RepID=A0A6V7WHR8_MELEN|nr:unnamed protein product [Meloidogyne enterolobii]